MVDVVRVELDPCRKSPRRSWDLHKGRSHASLRRPLDLATITGVAVGGVLFVGVVVWWLGWRRGDRSKATAPMWPPRFVAPTGWTVDRSAEPVEQINLTGPEGNTVLYQWLIGSNAAALLESLIPAQTKEFQAPPRQTLFRAYSSLIGAGVMIQGTGTEKNINRRTFVRQVDDCVFVAHVTYLSDGAACAAVERSFRAPGGWGT